MKIPSQLLVLLMLSPFAFSEMKPSMAQTSSFLVQELENNYTTVLHDLCQPELFGISDLRMDVDVEFGDLSINRSCRVMDPGPSRAYFSARIPLSKVNYLFLRQYERGEAEVFSLFFMTDRNSCITLTTSYMVNKRWWDTNESIEPYQDTEENCSDQIALILQNYSEENLKASKRIFNALKRYAELNDWEIEFKDETYQQVNGSMFD
jgi:hypothetical protein